MDLVPTLSALLGLPIPYSSLGGIIPELFTRLDEYSTSENMGEKVTECSNCNGEVCADLNIGNKTNLSLEVINITNCNYDSVIERHTNCNDRSSNEVYLNNSDNNSLLNALLVNSLQVMQYLQTYFKVNDNDNTFIYPTTKVALFPVSKQHTMDTLYTHVCSLLFHNSVTTELSTMKLLLKN